MGNSCSRCCNPNSNGPQNRKPLEKPLTDPSPVFPPESSPSYYHLSLVKCESAPHPGSTISAPGTTILCASGQDGGLSASGSNLAARHSVNLSDFKSERKSLVSRIPPVLGRSGSNENKHGSESKIQNLFAKYKDPNDDAILTEGIEALCIDLELKPEEFKVLVLAWKCQAEQMCKFTRSEFVQGCRSLKADSLRGIQQRLPEAVQEVLSNVELFKDLYRFTFHFGLDKDQGQRILPIDMAVSLWLLVFSQNPPPLLARWIPFLQTHPQIRGIPRDTWYMFLNFIEAIGNDLSMYDDTEAWPSLFDDFVEFENDQANQNTSKTDYKYDI